MKGTLERTITADSITAVPVTNHIYHMLQNKGNFFANFQQKPVHARGLAIA